MNWLWQGLFFTGSLSAVVAVCFAIMMGLCSRRLRILRTEASFESLWERRWAVSDAEEAHADCQFVVVWSILVTVVFYGAGACVMVGCR